MIKLAFEAPISCIARIANMADYDFILTHIVEKSKKYAEFYRKQKKKNRYSILDNSAFELGEGVSAERILNAADIVKADCVVAPDILGNCDRTIALSTEFIDYVKSKSYGYKIAVVIQGSSFEEWLKCYNTFINDKNVDTIGVNFALNFEVPKEKAEKSQTRKWLERRIKIFEYLVDNKLINSDKKYHLLGASDCIEYRFLTKYNFITTADTSSPVVHGVNNILYKDYGLPCEKIAKRLDFNAKITLNQLQNITKNIRVVKRFAE